MLTNGFLVFGLDREFALSNVLHRVFFRLYNAGVPCPQPVLLRSHVLVMEFLGTNGWYCTVLL